MNMEAQLSCDVLIVGFGPSGAVAAGLLGRAGHKAMVIDLLTTIYDKPRAIALDHEIYRHFDNMGVLEVVAPYVEPFTASQHFGAEGQLIRRVDMVPEPYPLGYVPSMVFTQPPVEAQLRRHAAEQPSVTIELGTELTALADAGHHVVGTLLAADGSKQQVTTRYVLGCDGASSTVRQLSDIRLEDLVFDEPWLVIDVLVKPDALAKLPQTSAQFCNPTRPASFIMGPKNHRRWEIMLLPGEDRRHMEQPEQVWKLLAPWLTAADGELWRANSYRFHALVAETWRRGRILLAGDAAHQQPPFFGQGMCQGIRDVTNLAWKLDRVLRWVSDDHLLDSYTLERKPHVIELTNKIKAVGQAICERDPTRARERDAQALADGGGKPRTITRQEIIPPLRAGFLAEQKGPARGTLFPQPHVTTETGDRLLDKITGAGWRLVLDGRRAHAPELVAQATAAGLTVAIVVPASQSSADAFSLRERAGVLAGWFDRHEVIGAIVRPDHYVFGAADTDAALAALIDEHERRLASSAQPIPVDRRPSCLNI